MPRGPRGERRPEDPAQAAVMVVRLATGEIDEVLDENIKTKNPSAVALGRLGGQKGGVARANKLSPFERQKIAKQAAKVRWSTRTENEKE